MYDEYEASSCMSARLIVIDPGRNSGLNVDVISRWYNAFSSKVALADAS
jgi:hypothetical protein